MPQPIDDSNCSRKATIQNRRGFLRDAVLASGAVGLAQMLPDSIRKALAIEPEPGSTFWDAEHVVILMQENRSFDHAFGTLRGVRGFNDPRAIRLPNGNAVWVQTNAAGESYAPFRLEIEASNSTWMGCLPHNWTDQTDARNEGRFDRWLQVKGSGEAAYAGMPLTLGHYNRDDIPFYYELADAFTICDQHFCSSLTGTTPNRLHLWSGTIRQHPREDSHAKVLNSDADHAAEIEWTTFPERLEDLGVSWKCYQNELYVDVGLDEEAAAWLNNFGDNPLEYFKQYHVRFSPAYRRNLEKLAESLPAEIADLETQLASQAFSARQAARKKKQLARMRNRLSDVEAERRLWSEENYQKLSPREKNLHAKAFSTNTDDPAQHELESIAYQDAGVERTMRAPRGDILHQFRRDVETGALPTVSWITAPEKFSDHPCQAWYGAWYIAEVLNILTQNPEVWKKTIFLLTYDENDGYFDHVPPFVCPHPRRPETGMVSPGIDPGVEYVAIEEDRKYKQASEARDSSIGLGYRVPLVIASPWTRGGCVCSQVFDHTSPLRLLEQLLSRKLGYEVKETNISQWRRTVCGDLTAAFRSAPIEEAEPLTFPPRNEFIEGIHRAQFRQLHNGFKRLTPAEIDQINSEPHTSPLMPQQEPGVRPSCPLPYELAVTGALSDDRRRFAIRFEARNRRFGELSAGSPFTVYCRPRAGELSTRNYAVAAGGELEDSWPLADFAEGVYRLEARGPNGFLREFCGNADDPPLDVELIEQVEAAADSAATGNVELRLTNRDPSRTLTIEVDDVGHGRDGFHRQVPAGQTVSCPIKAQNSHGWYDLRLRVAGGTHFKRHYAGRVETGRWSTSDPAMGPVDA